MATNKIDSRQITHKGTISQIATTAVTEIDNVVVSVDAELTPPLRLSASSPNDRVISVGPAIVVNPETLRQRSIPHVGTLLPNSFTSGTYTFPSASGGTIVASPGVNNTLTVPSGQYVKVLLYMDTLGLLNTLVGDPNAVEATATVLPAPDSSLPIGYVTIHNTAGTIDVISQTKIYQFGTGAGGGGSGDATSLDVILRDRFAVTDFEFLEENLFKKDQSTKVDGASTGSFSFAKSAWLLNSIGQTMVSYNLLDPIFLAEGVDVTDVEFYLQWLSGFVDGSATYQASRDGGTNWTTMTMSLIGSGDYRGYLTFADEVTQQNLQTYANSNSDTNSSLTGSGANQARAQKFTVTSTEVLRSMDIYLNKVQTSGTVAGKYKISIVRDSAGSPSVAAQDNISESDLLNASGLSTGLNTVTVTMPQVVMVPGDYWIVFSTDADYKASYSAAVRSIDVRSDTSPFGTGTPPSAYTFDGTTWTVSAGPIALVYLLKGRVHDLRVRVTAGTATKYIEGYGVYYGLQSGVTSASGEKSFQKFYFTGDSNTTDFTLTFTPDPELLEILDPYRGQSYAIEEGVARIIGQVVRFEPNTFNFPGENIVLIFRQVKGSTIDNSNANAVAISTINSNLLDVGVQLVDTQRVAVPLLSVPNTTIVNRAQIPDPSQDLKPRLAIERIPTQQITLIQNEFGGSGEPVWQVLNDDRGLIRFVGSWAPSAITAGAGMVSTLATDYVEITFYGTGLNFLTNIFTTTLDARASFDGGGEGSNLIPAGSNVLSGRNYSPNTLIPVFSGLTLGTHTVKIRNNNAAANMVVLGFDILNENQVTTTGNTHTSALIDGIPSTAALALGMNVSGSGVPANTTITAINSSTSVTISNATTSTLSATAIVFAGSLKINPGFAYNAGKKQTLASAQTHSYNSGFETGTLGTKGGRVLVYQKSDGTLGKAVTPVPTSPTYFTGSVDHSNEDIARTYHWREFGSRNGLAADDFSSLVGSASDRAYTLDDGTTCLTGKNVLDGAPVSVQTVEGTGAGAFVTLTFVGSGLDLIYANNANARNTDISVDGVSIGTLSLSATSVLHKQAKIASGLPYGTHTVKMLRNTLDTIFIEQFVVYQPKKPTLPAGAVELADYNILANYVIGTAGLDNIATGVLRKGSTREFTYVGTGYTANVPGVSVGVYINGISVYTNVSGDKLSYYFYGTGIEHRANANSTVPWSNNISVKLQNVSAAGTLLAATTANFPTLNASVYGGFSFSAGTLSEAVSNTAGSGLVLSGLPLSWWKVEFTNNTSSFFLTEAIDIITPIHSHKSNIYADLQNALPVGSCGISDNRPTKTIKEFTSLPSKAWAQAVGVTSGPSIATGTPTAGLPMPDMSVTLKTSGGPLDISFVGEFENSTSVGLPSAWLIYMDGILVDPEKQWNTAGAGYSFIMSSHLIVPASAGVHKVDVYWRSPSNGTLTAKGTRRMLTVQEK